MMLVFDSEHFFFCENACWYIAGLWMGECLVIVGMFIGMYGDTCIVAPHLGCLDEVVWMRGHNLFLSGRC